MFDSLFLQRTYADMLGSRLEGWRVQSYSPYRANFRCPICGDSQKNRFKKRGFILEQTGYLYFMCHNECGAIGFEKFLRDYHNDLFTSYRLDRIRNNYKDEQEEVYEEVSFEPEVNTLTDLDLENFQTNPAAFEYVSKRKIPESFWDDIFYTDQYYKFINDITPGKFPDSYSDHIDHRIVLPLRDFNGEIFGVIGRSLDPGNQRKYLTIKFDDSKPKLFGLERINTSSNIKVLEGPIDSYFVENAIALAGTDGNPDEVFDKSQLIMILDNQPRSESVVKKYQKYISQGYKMMIWPKHIKSKDINEMIISEEITLNKIESLIQSNTYSGLMLDINFNNWRKV